MCRFAFLGLALLLSSCTDAHRALTPDAAVDEAHAAAAQGDARRALNLLRSAAARDHLGALATLAAAYERGYLTAAAHGSAVKVPIKTLPWDGSRWRRIYDAEVERRAADGDPEGLHVQASRLMGRSYQEGRWTGPVAAEVAEGRAILAGLADQGDTRAMVRLGFDALQEDRATGAAWFEQAQAAGDAQACWYVFFLVDRVPTTFSASSLASAIDRAEVCRGMAPAGSPLTYDYSTRAVRSLTTAAARGNADAGAQLDSLRALGVFQRHPHLAAAERRDRG